MRFGIVGCGVIGPSHAAAIRGLPDAELVAVADDVPERADELARRYGVPAYRSLREMLDRDDLDVVNICTPSGLHGRHAIEAMRSGRHVIVEKPMDIRLEMTDEMLAVQREAGVKLAVISQRRFDPAAQKLHRLIADGALGRLVLANAHVFWWRSQQYYDGGAWRGTWDLDGGGVLMNQSIHSIDVLQWLMGPVRSVRAYADTLVHRMETEDVAAAALRFANGALGTIAATTGAYPGVTTRIEIFGDRGSAIIQDDRLGYLHLARDEAGEAGAYGQLGGVPEIQSAGAAANPADLPTNSHLPQIADMIRAIREDGTPAVDGVSARHPVQIILGIYESARTGQEVTLT